ncbi:class III signal peptide-containing protein, partial [Methanobrevibacter sp.]|uniref:class III signal peptide-containing protein n=1 Tax=Methanobrevibacter sp. TaxID=66852 RepID=UPI00386958FB
MKDNRAQISLEYILIFAISLLVLMIFTLPLAEDSIKNTVDVSDSLNARYCMSNIAQAIKEVYGEGQGSKRTLDIDSDKQIRVSVSD